MISDCCKAEVNYLWCTECEGYGLDPYKCDLYTHGICSECKELNGVDDK